jgi:hypothetical protein
MINYIKSLRKIYKENTREICWLVRTFENDMAKLYKCMGSRTILGTAKLIAVQDGIQMLTEKTGYY